MLTPVTLLSMDDKPAIEYHPFGTITLNFDDGPVKLRRCRLGDLQYAKDLLEEIRTRVAEMRDGWLADIAREREGIPDLDVPDEERKAYFTNLSQEERVALGAKTDRINQINETIRIANREIVHEWLSAVAVRMGDSPLPPKEEWPLDILGVQINDIIDHWQTRPLASGRTLGQNRTTLEAANSGPPLHIVSSPPEPQQQ